jgi:hypothetical protein
MFVEDKAENKERDCEENKLWVTSLRSRLRKKPREKTAIMGLSLCCCAQ